MYVFRAHGYNSASLRSRLVLPIPDDQYISTIIENNLSVRFYYHFLLGRSDFEVRIHNILHVAHHLYVFS